MAQERRCSGVVMVLVSVALLCSGSQTRKHTSTMTQSRRDPPHRNTAADGSAVGLLCCGSAAVGFYAVGLLLWVSLLLFCSALGLRSM